MHLCSQGVEYYATEYGKITRRPERTGTSVPWLTKYKPQAPSWKSSTLSSTHELLGTSQHQNYIQYDPLLDPDPSQMNPVHTSLRHFKFLQYHFLLKIYALIFGFSYQNVAYCRRGSDHQNNAKHESVYHTYFSLHSVLTYYCSVLHF